MATAFIFPGQGSQAVGMGKALADSYPASRAVFDEVDAALGQKLSSIIFEGSADDLTRTANTQPALLAVSIAALRALEAEGVSLADRAVAVAGHSLGEYVALTAAGSLGLADAARLLRIRGDAMQAAVPEGEGAMAALLGLDFPEAAAVASEAAAGGGVCQAANDNAPGQVVVSGSAATVARAVEIAKGRGAKRAMMLNVSAPFHCTLMQPAADRMAEALAGVELRAPIVPLYANVLAAPINDPAEIRRRLVEQVTGTVRWRESVGAMVAAGITTYLEVGAGKVLSGLVKRTAAETRQSNVGTPEEARAAAEFLGG